METDELKISFRQTSDSGVVVGDK